MRLKKIGITGPSGAGKTTQAEYSGREMGFIAFQGDEIMWKCLFDCPDIATRIFGRAPEAGEDVREFVFTSQLDFTPKKERALFDLTRDYIEQQLVWVFANPTTDFGSHERLHEAVLFQPKKSPELVIQPEGVIVEMCGFHKAKHLMRRTDFKVLVDSDKEARKRMLFRRENMREFIRQGKFDEVVAIREAIHNIPEDAKMDLRIMNRYNSESLKHGQRQIVDMIKSHGIDI